MVSGENFIMEHRSYSASYMYMITATVFTEALNYISLAPVSGNTNHSHRS